MTVMTEDNEGPIPEQVFLYVSANDLRNVLKLAQLDEQHLEDFTSRNQQLNECHREVRKLNECHREVWKLNE